MNELDIGMIRRLLPHRYPMLLVDRVLDWEAGKFMRGMKNVTANEPFFQGHFPDYPVMPGVLVIEAMAQVAGLLTMLSDVARRDGSQLVLFAGIDEARFKRQVFPGDTLIARSASRARGARHRQASARARPSASSWCARRSCSPPFATCRRCPICRSEALRRADDSSHGARRRRAHGSPTTSTSAPYTIVGAEVTIGAGTRIGPHVVDHRPHDDRRAQPHLPVRVGRRDSAGPQVRRRADDDHDRRRQRRSRIRDDPRGHGAGPRRDDDRQRQLVSRLHARRARLHRRQLHDVLEQRADRRARDDRRLGGARRVRRRPPVLPHRRARDARGGRDRAAGRPALRHGGRVPGEAGRHQQRGPAPARLLGRGHRHGAPRVQDAVSQRACRSRAARDALAAAARDAPLLAPLVEFLAGSVRGIVR